MDDRQLDKIISSTALRQTQLIIESMPTQEIPNISPSEGFEDRINDLIKYHNKNRNLQSIRRRIGGIAASILVVFSITFGIFFTVSASKDNVMHFFDRYFAYNSGKAEIWNTQFNAQICNHVHDVYLPTWVPNGFKATESQQGKSITYFTYSCGGKTIRLSQSSATSQYNDDELKQMTELTINNQKYYYGEKGFGNSVIRKLIWNNNQCTFVVITSVSKDDALKFAQSLKFKKG